MNQLHPVFADILRDVQAVHRQAAPIEPLIPAPIWPRPSTVAIYGSPHSASAAAAHQAAIDREAEERGAADEWIERRAMEIMRDIAATDLKATIRTRGGRMVRDGQAVDGATEALFADEDIDGKQPYSQVRAALVAAAHSYVKRSDSSAAGDILRGALWDVAVAQAEAECEARAAR